MITKGDLPKVLSEAGERFSCKVEEFLKEWRNDPGAAPDELPDYILMGELAGVVVSDIATRNHQASSTQFEVIERLHVDGDEYVRELATIGLLEAIQGHLKGERLKFDRVHDYLGPESRIWWDKLIRFWDEGDAKALRYD